MIFLLFLLFKFLNFADFWTSNIAQKDNDSLPSQKHPNLESSNNRYFSKKSSSLTKHNVSNATNGGTVFKCAIKKCVNTLTNTSVNKDGELLFNFFKETIRKK